MKSTDPLNWISVQIDTKMQRCLIHAIVHWPPNDVRNVGYDKGVFTEAQASWPDELTLSQTVESTERTLLLEARERYGNQSKIARALGVDQSTIARKMMKKYRLS